MPASPRRIALTIAAAAALIALGGSPARVQAAPDAAGLELFEKDVRPLLAKYCYECHSTKEANGGLVLDTRDGVLKGGDTGPAVTPGDPAKSLLIEAVRYTNRDLQMPPKNRLSAAEVAALEKWIKLGAPDPRESAQAAASGGPAPVGMSILDGREFWSFKPVADPPVPQVRDASWVKTPIDAFVLARLEGQGIQPAPPADKRTLIRRVTFDLTGLPPTPQEVEAFLADNGADALDKVVERLLQSPGYGVRWGRHWLDVARYADSNGLDENLAFGNAWRYRDYVVEAFNQDKPFHQFLVEQIAGDLLPYANQETKTATGFLVLGAKVLAEPDKEKLVMDIIDEQIDSTGKAFLGLTLGCVRCHDHKFDPIKQRDYYALAAIFKSTKTLEGNNGSIKHWHEYSFARPEELDGLKSVNAAINEKKKAASDYKNVALAKIRTAARAKATEYLVAAAGFDPSMPLTQVEKLAAPLALHPYILHHCRLHLDYHRDDPLLGKWHEFAAAGDVEGIDKHYRELFAEADAALAAAKKEDPKATKLKDERLERARAAINNPSGFLAVPSKIETALDPAALAEYHRLADIARIAESSAPDATGAMGVTDGPIVASVPIHIRGSHRNLGESFGREFPEVMRASSVRPIMPLKHSGRLELAQWMASTEHPLTARVYVNRVWRWHFGAGIVASTENFGKLGDRPTHPDLLDWLARHFMASGWSTKELHRLMLRSSVYQMASLHPQEAAAMSADPENRLLWRFRLQRLEAEEIRDAVLAVAGRLDQTLGGKSIPLRNRQFVFDHTSIDHTKYDSLRRALYLPVVRNNLYTLFEQFDYPDPTMPTGNRNATVVAPQALLMMNSNLIMDSANAMAGRLLERNEDDTQRASEAYQLAVGRPPSESELKRVLEFVGEMSASGEDASARRQAWSLFCQGLLASNEFIYLR